MLYDRLKGTDKRSCRITQFGGNDMVKCELVEMPARHILSVRTRTPVQNLPNVLGRVYVSIMQYLGELGETPHCAPFVAYFNMDMSDLDIEAGYVVQKELPPHEDIKPGVIPAGRSAQCVHIGPYDQCTVAYDALSQWMATNDLEPTGVAYEFYLNEPGVTPPEELQTLIQFPLV